MPSRSLKSIQREHEIVREESMRKDKAGGVEMHTAKRETHDDKIEVIKEPAEGI